MSGAKFGFPSTNTYILLNSTIYYDQATVTNNMVYLQDVSTQPSGASPITSFGFGSPNANLTLVSIVPGEIDIAVSPSNQLMNMTFYYGYIGSVPQAVQIGSQVVNIQHYNSPTCVVNCVIWNSAAQTITIVADPSYLFIFTSPNGCSNQYTIGLSLTGQVSLLVVLPIILAAGIIISLLLRFGQEDSGASVIIPVIAVLAISVAIIIAYVILAQTTNVGSLILGC